MSDDIGDPREAGMNILLFFVTGMVYWFFWQWKAFREITRQRKMQVRTWPTVFLILAPLFYAGATLWGLHMAFDRHVGPAKKHFGLFYFTPFWIGAVVLLIAYFILQAYHARRMNNIIREANLTFGDDRTPPNQLAFAWGWLFVFFWLPLGIGPLLGFFGTILWGVWSYMVQEAMNRYWLGHVSLPQDTPPGLKAPTG